MTKEEKAQAYDEALDRMKHVVIVPKDEKALQALKETIFPELAESEDERIRKHLITIVELYWGKTNDPDKAKELAYLEKQKAMTAEEHETVKVNINGIHGLFPPVGDGHYIDEHVALDKTAGEKQKEQSLRDFIEDFPYSAEQKEQNDIPLMNGDADLYFDNWIQHNDTTKRGYFEEGIRYAQRLQKEQKPSINIDQLKSLMLQYLQEAANEKDDSDIEADTNKWARKILGYDFEQKEQKPAEWNEDYDEENIQTRFAFYTYKDEPSTLYLSNVFVEESSRNHGFGTRILKAAEKVAEAIGAITISLKVKQNSPANAWYRKSGYGYVSFQDGYDWLEKNLEYMKPNKQEWSEEDEDMLNCCISSIEEAKENRYAYKETDGDTSYDHEIAWLKLLRPSWKPSKEQMDALNALSYVGQQNQLIYLYNDLKKLM